MLTANITKSQLNEWAEFYAREDSETDNIWAAAEWLHFSIDKERFIIPMNKLDEVSTVTTGITIPNLPPVAIGLLNLRGETVLTFDLGQMLGLRGAVEPNSKQRVLLFKENEDNQHQRSAFMVDEIIAVTDVDDENLQKLHDGDDSEKNRYIDAVTESTDGEAISRIQVEALLRGVREML